MTLAIFGLGPVEIGVIGLIAVLLFGRRLPDVARSLGRAIPSLRRGMKDIEEEIDDAKRLIKDPPPEKKEDSKLHRVEGRELE